MKNQSNHSPNQTKTKKKHHYLVFPKLDSLYLPSKKLLDLIHHVKTLINRKEDHIIYFLTTGSLDDNWMKLLSYDQYFASEIITHLIKLRDFFKLIYNNKNRFVFCGEGSIHGSFFELYLCVGLRYIANENALFGFSEWNKGYFPAGGVCEVLHHQGLIKKSFWNKYTVFTPYELTDEFVPKIISQSSYAHCLNFVVKLICSKNNINNLNRHNLLEKNPKDLLVYLAGEKNIPILSTSCYKTPAFSEIFHSDTMPSTGCDKNIAKALKAQSSGDKRLHSYKYHNFDFFDDIWSSFWKYLNHNHDPQTTHLHLSDISKSHNNQNSNLPINHTNDNYNSLVSHLCLIYQGWKTAARNGYIPQTIDIKCLYHQNNTPNQNTLSGLPTNIDNKDKKDNKHTNEDKFRYICVDCTQSTPAISLIIFWLYQGHSIMLINSSCEILSKQLTLLYQELNDHFSKNQLTTVINHRIFSLVVSPNQFRNIDFSYNNPVVKISRLYFLSVKFKGTEQLFFRLSGNDFDSKIGITEKIYDHRDDFTKENDLNRNTFSTNNKIIPGVMLKSCFCDLLPLAVWLRIQFWLAVSIESTQSSLSIQTISKKLVSFGWRFDPDLITMRNLISDYGQAMKELVKSIKSPSSPQWIKNLPKEFKPHRFDKFFPFNGEWKEIIIRYKSITDQNCDKVIHYPRHRVDELLSNHFTLLALFLCYQLVLEKCFNNLSLAQLFVIDAMGVPKKIGSLQLYARNYGLDMLVDYAQKHFPNQEFQKAIIKYYH